MHIRRSDAGDFRIWKEYDPQLGRGYLQFLSAGWRTYKALAMGKMPMLKTLANGYSMCVATCIKATPLISGTLQILSVGFGLTVTMIGRSSGTQRSSGPQAAMERS